MSTILYTTWERLSYPSILCFVTEEVENSNAIFGIDEVEKLDEPKSGIVRTSRL